jgi:hypothetical protein
MEEIYDDKLIKNKVIFLLIYVVFSMILPIIILVEIHKNNIEYIECIKSENYINKENKEYIINIISIYLWLFIFSIFRIFDLTITSLYLLFYYKYNIDANIRNNIISKLYHSLKITIYILMLFKLVWCIIGIIIYHGNCNDIKPSNIKKIYNATYILIVIDLIICIIKVNLKNESN